MSPIGELAASVRRLTKLLDECDPACRPPLAPLFAELQDVRDDVVELTRGDREIEALAIVEDFERRAGAKIATRVLNSPLKAG